MAEKIAGGDRVKRNIYLDYLRGLSAVCVILFHYTTRYDQLFQHREAYFFNLPWGNQAIFAFYLLSGYFAMNRIETGSLKQYLARRFFRLYPVYWLSVLVIFPITWFFLPSRAVSLKDALINLTMFQDFLGVPKVDGAYWTLKYEIDLYLVISVIFLLNLKKYPERLCAGWTALQILCVILPDAAPFAYYVKRINEVFLLGTGYGQTIMMGAIISCLEKTLLIKKERRWLKAALLLGSLAFCMLRLLWIFGKRCGLDIALMIALIMLAVILHERGVRPTGPVEKLLRPLAFVAAVSYPLFLFHQNIGYAILLGLESHGLTNEVFMLVPIAFMVGIAYLIHRFVERPLRKYAVSI